LCDASGGPGAPWRRLSEAEGQHRGDGLEAVALPSRRGRAWPGQTTSFPSGFLRDAQRAGTKAYLVDGPEDIQLGWLAGVSTVGIAAGASAPPAIVGQIVAALGGLGEVETKDVVVATETVQFGLPKELRQRPVN
jgi:hypothetical protein